MNDKLKSTLTLVGIPLGGSSRILGLGTTTMIISRYMLQPPTVASQELIVLVYPH